MTASKVIMVSARKERCFQDEMLTNLIMLYKLDALSHIKDDKIHNAVKLAVTVGAVVFDILE